MDDLSQVAGRYLDGRYVDANPTWHDEDGPAKADKVIQILSAHPEINVSSICDIGCGTGGVLASLAQRMPASVRLTGFEPSGYAVSIAQQKRPGLDIRERVATLADGPFDVALVLDVFEHVEDYFGFLRSLRGLAHNYVFHIPLDMMVLNLMFPAHLRARRENLGHLHYFCADTALATLEAVGYEPVDWQFTLVTDDDPREPAHVRVVRQIRSLGWRTAPELTARILGGISLIVLAREAAPSSPTAG